MASSSEQDARDDVLDEVLVAYLDGQLAGEQCERIEAQLSRDENVRQRLQELDRVWNALDVLPRSTASPAFTRSTVEMAAVAAVKPGPLPAGGGRRRLPIGAGVGFVGLALGALLAYLVVGGPERRALNDLPIAMQAAAMENAGSIEFLMLLADDPPRQFKPLVTNELRGEAGKWGEVTAMTTPERRDWLTELEPRELAELNTAVDRFQDRTSTKRASLHDFAADLNAHEQASKLREAAVVYQSIVSRLPQSEQARLRQMEPGQRLEQLRKNASRFLREVALELTSEQRVEFRAAVDRLVTSSEFREEAEQLRDGLPPHLRDADRERLIFQRPKLMLYATTRFVARPRWWQELEQRRGVRVPPGRREEFRQMAEQFEAKVGEPITKAWRGWADRLQAALPEPTQRALIEAAAKGDAQRARLFERLLREAAPENLSDTFADLPEQQIEQLILLPRNEFIEVLGERGDSGFEFDVPPPGDGFIGRPPRPPGGGRHGERGGRPRGFEDRFNGRRPPPPGDRVD